MNMLQVARLVVRVAVMHLGTARDFPAARLANQTRFVPRLVRGLEVSARDWLLTTRADPAKKENISINECHRCSEIETKKVGDKKLPFWSEARS